MQSLLLAVSKNARVPSAPKNVLLASLSTLVLPCLRSDFSLSLPLTGLGLQGLLSSFPCTLTQCPLPWHWLCGWLFCLSVGFATVVMVVGKEIHKKAGNGKQIDKSRPGVKGEGKRQRVTVSSLTSPDKVISNLSFHCWWRRFEGKGIAIFFLMGELVKMGRSRTNFWPQTPFF